MNYETKASMTMAKTNNKINILHIKIKVVCWRVLSDDVQTWSFYQSGCIRQHWSYDTLKYDTANKEHLHSNGRDTVIKE